MIAGFVSSVTDILLSVCIPALVAFGAAEGG